MQILRKRREPFFLSWLALLAAMGLAGCPANMQPARRAQPFSEALPARWNDEPVIVMSDSSIYRYGLGGKTPLAAERITWYWIRKRTPEVLSRLPVFDFETIETPPEVKVMARFEDGTSWENGIGFSRVNVPEEGAVASNRFIQIVALPRYAAGTWVRLHVKRRYLRPEFVPGEAMRGPFPTLSRTISISGPAGWPLKCGLVNGENLPVRASSRELPKGGIVKQWQADSLERIDSRNPLADPLAWYATVRMAWPLPASKAERSAPAPDPVEPTWRALGDHYLDLADASMQISPAIQAFARALADGPADSLIARAFASLGKRLRYHADEERLHAFVPRNAETIFARGYGDCKEMSLLLHLVLLERGIESRLALVAAPPAGQAARDYPTLGHFNHMILAVPGQGGEGWRFVDPTLGQWPAFRSTLVLAGRRALVLGRGQTQWVEIPVPAGSLQEIETRNTVRDQGNGRWLMEGTIEMHGLAAQYVVPNLQGLDREEKASFLNSFLAESFGLSVLSQEAVENRPDCLRIEYRADFTPHYLQLDKGGLALGAPTLFGGRSGYTTLDLEGPREFKALVQTDTWILPKGFTEFEGEGMGGALAKASFTRGKGEVRRRFEGVQRTYMRGDSTVSQFQRDRDRLHKASVWRKY